MNLFFNKTNFFELCIILLSMLSTMAIAETSVTKSNLSNIEYDIETAYKLAVASDCAYRLEGEMVRGESALDCLKKSRIIDFKELKKYQGIQNNQDVYYIWEAKKENSSCSKEGIDAYLLISTKEYVILAIRGTLPPIFYNQETDRNFINDWKNNFNLDLISVSSNLEKDKTSHHVGFMKSWECTKESLVAGISDSFLREHLYGDKNLNKKFYITGHSKGGAIAIVAAIKSLEGGDHWPLEKRPNTIYTFSAPRPFTTGQAAQYAEKYGTSLRNLLWRLEYKADIIPLLPPGSEFYSYLISNNEFAFVANLLDIVFPLKRITDPIVYDSTGLGRLYYVNKDNDLKEVDKNEIAAEQMNNIKDTYKIKNVIKNFMNREEFWKYFDLYESSNILRKLNFPYCYEIVNNHQAYTAYLRMLNYGKIRQDEEIHSEWDKFCTVESILHTGNKDIIRRVFESYSQIKSPICFLMKIDIFNNANPNFKSLCK